MWPQKEVVKVEWEKKILGARTKTKGSGFWMASLFIIITITNGFPYGKKIGASI